MLIYDYIYFIHLDKLSIISYCITQNYYTKNTAMTLHHFHLRFTFAFDCFIPWRHVPMFELCTLQVVYMILYPPTDMLIVGKIGVRMHYNYM